MRNWCGGIANPASLLRERSLARRSTPSREGLFGHAPCETMADLPVYRRFRNRPCAKERRGASHDSRLRRAMRANANPAKKGGACADFRRRCRTAALTTGSVAQPWNYATAYMSLSTSDATVCRGCHVPCPVGWRLRLSHGVCS